MKEKSTSEKQEHFLMPGPATEISSKESTPWQAPCNIHWTIIKMDEEEIQTNQRMNKAIANNNSNIRTK